MKPKHKSSSVSLRLLKPAAGFAAALVAITVSSWFSLAGAQPASSLGDCNKRVYPGISPQTAEQAGMALTPGGMYEMDMNALAAQAGSPIDLLRLSRQQYNTNKQWLASMERLVADTRTPMLPEVQAVYQQGWETNVIEMSIIHAMECQLGLPLSELETPKAPAVAVAEREARIAKAKADAQAQAQAEEQKRASQASFNRALSGIANVLGAAASAFGRGSGYSGSVGGNCPWDGHDYSCETAPGN